MRLNSHSRLGLIRAFLDVMDKGADPLEIDAVLAALTTASESRRALSRLAGALLDAYSALGIDAPKLRTYAAAIAQGLAQGHPRLLSKRSTSLANLL